MCEGRAHSRGVHPTPALRGLVLATTPGRVVGSTPVLCAAAEARCCCSPYGNLRLSGAPPGSLHATSGHEAAARQGEGEPYPLPGCCVCMCPPAPHSHSELLGEQRCRVMLGNMPRFLSHRCPSLSAASGTHLSVLSNAPGAGFQSPFLKNSEEGGPHGHAAPSK